MTSPAWTAGAVHRHPLALMRSIILD
jgi:hypothetical protein